MLDSLTFTTLHASGCRDLWTPERPAKYPDACAMGRDYAAELLVYIAATGDSAMFGAVMRAITRGGLYEGVEIGFCSHIGIHLVGIQASQPYSAVQPVAA